MQGGKGHGERYIIGKEEDTEGGKEGEETKRSKKGLTETAWAAAGLCIALGGGTERLVR